MKLERISKLPNKGLFIYYGRQVGGGEEIDIFFFLTGGGGEKGQI